MKLSTAWILGALFFSSVAKASTWMELNIPIYIGSDENSARSSSGFSGALFKDRGDGTFKLLFGMEGGLSSGKLRSGGDSFSYSSFAVQTLFGVNFHPFAAEFLAPFFGANVVAGFDIITTSTSPTGESQYSGAFRYGYEFFGGTSLNVSAKTQLMLRAVYSVVQRSYAGQTFEWNALKLAVGLKF